MELTVLEALNEARRTRRGSVLVTDLSGGEQRLVLEGEDHSGDPFADEIEARLRSGRSGRIETADGRQVFFRVDTPPARLVLVGAVHISQALAPMAIATGFDVTIVDPRTAFATPERFAGLNLVTEWPQDVLGEVGLDRHTAFAALTHDPKIDDPALIAALRAGCFYVGALGSRKTHGRRVERLVEAGLTEAEIGRIHAPIGLAIGAATPAEIAVAVLGEIIAARRLPAAGDKRADAA